MGPSGVKAVKEKLPKLIKEKNLDFEAIKQIEEEKFNSINVTLPGLEFHTDAVCEPNPQYCTDDGCPNFMTPLENEEKI